MFLGICAAIAFGAIILDFRYYIQYVQEQCNQCALFTMVTWITNYLLKLRNCLLIKKKKSNFHFNAVKKKFGMLHHVFFQLHSVSMQTEKAGYQIRGLQCSLGSVLSDFSPLFCVCAKVKEARLVLWVYNESWGLDIYWMCFDIDLLY